MAKMTPVLPIFAKFMARASPSSPRLLATAATKPMQASQKEDDAKAAHKSINEAAAEVKQTAEDVREKVNATADQVIDKTIEMAGKMDLVGTAKDTTQKVKDTVQDAWETAKDTTQKVKDTMFGKAEDGKEAIKESAEAGKDTIKKTAEAGKETVKGSAEKVKESAETVKRAMNMKN